MNDCLNLLIDLLKSDDGLGSSDKKFPSMILIISEWLFYNSYVVCTAVPNLSHANTRVILVFKYISESITLQKVVPVLAFHFRFPFPRIQRTLNTVDYPLVT